MKVICISNEVNNSIYYRGLVIGKVYDVIEHVIYESIDSDDYRIMNDNGHIHIYPTIIFKLLEEHRNEQIDKIML